MLRQTIRREAKADAYESVRRADDALEANSPFDPQMLAGICVYQDVLWQGVPRQIGVRDCEARWRLIEPHLPERGVVLDVGSNFGWFGLKVVDSRPACVVASLEADPHSAAVQRQVLASHASQRIALLTKRATAKRPRKWGEQGQRFAAAFCLSVLHWMPDHRQFLLELAQLCPVLFIECPAPEEEAGIGLSAARRGLSNVGELLIELFDSRSVTCLGFVAGLSSTSPQRAIWQVRCGSEPASQSCGLSLEAMLAQEIGWPQRSWWQDQLARPRSDVNLPAGCWLTPAGVTLGRSTSPDLPRRALRSIPEHILFTRTTLLRRRLRGAIRRVLSFSKRGE